MANNATYRLHLDYTTALPNEFVDTIRQEFANMAINLVYTAKKQQEYFDTYAPENCIVIPPISAEWLLQEEGTIQQSIQGLLLKTWQKYKAQQAVFGVQVQLDANTLFNFKLDQKFTEQEILQSIEQLFIFSKKQPLTRGYGNPFFIYYAPEQSQWKKVEVLDLLEDEEDSRAPKHKSSKRKKRRK